MPNPTASSPAARQALTAVLQQPGHPLALAACLPLAESSDDLRRSLKILRWLSAVGLPAESIRKQRFAFDGVLKTLELRAADADGAPFELLDVEGVGPLRMSVASEVGRAFLGLSGETDRGYEPGVLSFLVRAARQGQVVADVGAHTGYYSAIVGKAGGIVLGFEMNPDLAQEARRNIALNRLERAHVINAAVGDHDGLIFNMRFAPSPGLRVTDRIEAPPADAYRKVLFDPVLCVRLDTAFGRTRMTPDLVKMDIEGYEIDALRGARRLIEAGRTRFLVEFHPMLVSIFGHRPEHLLDCFPETWTVEVLENDGSLRPLGDADRRLFYDPPPVNMKLVFSPRPSPSPPRATSGPA